MIKSVNDSKEFYFQESFNKDFSKATLGKASPISIYAQYS